MKKKHLNTLKIASLTLMLGCFAVGGVYNHYEDKQQDNVVNVQRKVQPKYASYDDDEYIITLTADEVNNNTFENLCEVLSNNTSCSVSYNGNNSAYNGSYYLDTQLVGYFWKFGTYMGQYGYPNITLMYDTYTFTYRTSADSINELDYELNLNCFNETYYESIKNAIELDIQANQPTSMGDTIVGAITSGLGLIPDLAKEFLTGFSTLFWNSTTDTLTTFGLFSLVFLGIAITMAVIKLVLAIIRGNTGA